MDQIRDQEITPPSPDPAPAPGIFADEIQSELETILASRTFRPARGQSKFLAYTVAQSIAGRGQFIKEYLIGREALGRGESFDPRLDPIVRTQARKLRLRLEKYYQTEGAEDQIRIELPKGSYAPVFERAPGALGSLAVSPVEIVAPPAEPLDPVVPAPAPRQRKPFGWKTAAIAIPACILILAAAVALFQWLPGVRLSAASNESATIAVLPFVSLSDDRADGLLSDRLTSQLVDALRQVPNLQVVDQALSSRFKRNPNARQAAQQLRARAVILGSVWNRDNRLRVTVQLNDATHESPLWSGSYDRLMDEVSSMPAEISWAVANVLGLAGSSPDHPTLGTIGPAPPNLNAHRDNLPVH
ncbi:MAG TPA: hypothetical protein VME17_04570 [Bryobacteraceae bacterium]|nr:hypothetical protein [Bryobacteraceae bacterium]